MTVIISGSGGITSVNGTAAAPSVTGTDTDTGIVYGTNTLTLSTNGTAGLVQDASQIIGVGGITPSAWSSGKALEIGQLGSALFNDTSNNRTMMMQNLAFVSGYYQYQRSAAAGRVVLADGSFNYSAASSGTAGTSATLSNILLAAKGQSFALEGATQSAGTGIAFPATQSASSDANTLDDYEEGTWTPTIGSGTFTAGNAKYTKIGRLVQVSMYCQNFSDRSTVATLVISGLPFASASSTSDCVGSLFMRYTNNQVTATYISSNSSSITFYGSTSGNYTPLKYSDLNNSSAEIYLSITYYTNT